MPAYHKEFEQRVKLESGEEIAYHDRTFRVILLELWWSYTKPAYRQPDLAATIRNWTGLSAAGCQDTAYPLLSLTDEVDSVIPDYTIDMPELFLRVYRGSCGKKHEWDLIGNNPRPECEKGLTRRLMAGLRLSLLEICQVVERLWIEEVVHPKGGNELLYSAPVFLAADIARLEETDPTIDLETNSHALWPSSPANIRETVAKVATQIRQELNIQPCPAR